MSKRSFRIALVIVVATLLAAGAVAAYVANRALGYPDGRRAGSGQEVEIAIENGMSFPAVAALLAQRGVIDEPRLFRLYAMHRGVTTRIRTGHYVLRDNMTPREVIDRLLEGVKDVTVSVTIPEGLHILEVFRIIASAGVAKAEGLEATARDAEFLRKQGITGETVEGYLFPETYRFKVPTPPAQVLGTLIRQHRIVWDKVRRDNEKNIARLREKLGWSDYDLLILASIVEKEAVVDEERPRIAQVFINRLISPSFEPKRLETDPTIRYGCTVPTTKSVGCRQWDPTQRLRRAQLDDRDNPYNTYQHEGLPPGPICNPGARSLVAVANPDGSNYFFFVARNDGTHVFSRTVAEHERNVDKYQK
jgi:UPF0755 protein